ncbi:MAG: hypothetical protein RI986_511 [Planctomycetota bacterium]|jgi:hypothetical protein
MPRVRACLLAKRELQTSTPICGVGDIGLHFMAQSALQSLVVIAR